MRKILLVLFVIGLFAGCSMRVDPFSPRQKQRLENQNGKIEELKNNANGVQLELLKLRQQTEINARDLDRTQTGMLNKQNTGVQILQGDGAIIAIIVLTGMIMGGIAFISYYKTRATKAEKTTEIMATQIAFRNDQELEEAIFLAAMHTEVESDVYKIMLKKQTMLKKRGLR